MKLTKILLGLIPVILLTSCATIMHGSRQTIGISSNPACARIFVDNTYYGNTPMMTKLTRKDNHMVRIELEGYYPYETILTRQLSGWVFGNIVFGGVIGVAVDAITGGIYRLTPEQIEANLLQPVAQNKNGISYISVVLKPEASWEKIGQLSPIVQ
ncbi:MAG TPA: PEGA domain-containing protein [Parachlamydiaceae bacterium]|nr:PEGA domain-containing protein [Parachlamydiaceae bacterium]